MNALTRISTAPVRIVAQVQSRRAGTAQDAGMTTAEYAVGTVAACGFGGVLYKAVTSQVVLSLMKSVLLKALKLAL